jgi:hypothetical protein
LTTDATEKKAQLKRALIVGRAVLQLRRSSVALFFSRAVFPLRLSSGASFLR